ncbi:DUF1294 domain-containing protein [uncultured Cedecea sp.]|uniref:DUF1294 domain-containing protein n=1 Tax=uncultured Cedecea sp. TaxID=988762 RepID=UPI0026376BDE|nr:DUF1294 domain-containing protein [uncultured Cedecea sp.]
MNLERFCYLLLILSAAASLSQPEPQMTWLCLVNLLTFAIYGADKYAARKSWRRVPESVLLLFGFVGGWPGAVFGQKLFRHKTQKQPFKKYFMISVILNILAVSVLYWWFRYG